MQPATKFETIDSGRRALIGNRLRSCRRAGVFRRGCRTGKLERPVASDPWLTAATARNLERAVVRRAPTWRFIVEHNREIRPPGTDE